MMSDVLTVAVVVIHMIRMLRRCENAIAAMAMGRWAQIHVNIVVAKEPSFTIPAVELAIYLKMIKLA
ncbi:MULTISPECIES: hypothetical protein [Pseudomonas syringae group]|uniref:Secreted protein n=2 Tax=Pseudomonas syringae group TaxID=136849 RepID=A0ABY1UER9_PSESX|nr:MULTISPECIES: hypothetical protein [Pseudomonas syringae group]KWT06941.1 hypothetical protein AL046_22700 [Pseudomonas syringae pv. avii]PHN72288.1 hypothetical protein AO286_07920 [Pseudomonas syringae]POP93743.1 hypothetical protein CXB40_27870 [Pseudomonas syringae pv. avii]SOQ15597.1 hypothetical protein CFBP1573P_05639 [Pseudomonas syringae pv. persicae]SOQ15607.1 hypothetical protein NCPPB2254_05532 [Pseudomonas syringae pv. persicae]